jgi:predicted acylesterase/phospholipase RssA
MINEYVIKLIENLPDEIKNVKEPMIIDLVLDGGVFNGSYHAGALYFLKEMENRKYIKINRISGCSVGSIVGFLYFINSLDLMSNFYEVINTEFRQTYSLGFIKNMKNRGMKTALTTDF